MLQRWHLLAHTFLCLEPKRIQADFLASIKNDGYRQRNVRQYLHILASPGYAPGTIAVNVTWMERGCNACQSHRSMYPSIVNRFLIIQPVSSKVLHFTFSTFLHILASPGYSPGTIAVNFTWMKRKFNAGQTHRSIYPSVFNEL